MKVLCILLVLALTCACFAKPDEHRPTKRKFDIHVDKDNVNVQATYQNGTYEDKFKFQAHKDGGDHDFLKLNFDYETKTDVNKTHLQLNFVFKNIVEFLSTASVPVYKGDQTSIVNIWPAKGKQPKWGDWTDESGVVDGVNVYRYTATNGILKVSLHMAASAITVSGLAIDPNSVKVDFEVINFPYTGSASGTTRLSLLTNIKSKTQSKNKGEKAVNDHSLLFADDPNMPVGAFSWAPLAQIQDTNNLGDVDVLAYTPEQQTGKDFDVYFTFFTSDAYPHPANILWDPKFGLDYESDPGFCIGSICDGAAYGIVVGAVVVGLLVIVGVAVAVSRRKRVDYQEL